MAYTTHEKIRVESGFQERYSHERITLSPDGARTTFYVKSDSYLKFAPDFGTGTTVAGVSDIKVYGGLSGIAGSTRYAVFSVDPEMGSFTLSTAPASGSSLTVSYSSSAIPSYDIESARIESEAVINQKLSIAYNVPVGATCSTLTRLSTMLASAKLLMRNYGVAGRDTAADGYELYQRLMGKNQTIMGDKTSNIVEIGEIGMLTMPGYQLIDDSGNIIPRTDGDDIVGTTSYTANGTIAGHLYDVSEENFRFYSSRYDLNNNFTGHGTGFWGS